MTVDGYESGKYFTYGSPDLSLRVIGQSAELQSLFAMTEPYPPLGETLRCEANVVGLENTGKLDLKFWVDTPSGEFKELADIETKEFKPGEEAIYSTEITPEETGIYTIHAYLYDDNRRIDQQTDMIYVKE